MRFSPALVRAVLAGAGILLYAVAMHLTSAVYPNPDAAAVLVIAPLAGAAVVSAWNSAYPLPMLATCGLTGGLVAGGWTLLTDHVGWLYYLQHVGIYGLLALMFGRTLTRTRTPLCTQMAVFMHDEMTPRVERYTRRVTIAWTLYFLATVLISSVLYFFASFEAWSVFANVLGAPLIGAMFVIEFAIRRHVLPPEERGSLTNTWRAWKKHNARHEYNDGHAGKPPAP